MIKESERFRLIRASNNHDQRDKLFPREKVRNRSASRASRSACLETSACFEHDHRHVLADVCPIAFAMIDKSGSIRFILCDLHHFPGPCRVGRYRVERPPPVNGSIRDESSLPGCTRSRGAARDSRAKIARARARVLRPFRQLARKVADPVADLT